MMQIDNQQSKAQQAAFAPSCVLFVRNVPKDSTSEQIIDLFAQFGPVEQVLLLIEKSNAFV
jgi:RNA recognition motif-containing protein